MHEYMVSDTKECCCISVFHTMHLFRVCCRLHCFISLKRLHYGIKRKKMEPIDRETRMKGNRARMNEEL